MLRASVSLSVIKGRHGTIPAAVYGACCMHWHTKSWYTRPLLKGQLEGGWQGQGCPCNRQSGVQRGDQARAQRSRESLRRSEHCAVHTREGASRVVWTLMGDRESVRAQREHTQETP